MVAKTKPAELSHGKMETYSKGDKGLCLVVQRKGVSRTQVFEMVNVTKEKGWDVPAFRGEEKSGDRSARNTSQ